MKNKFEQYNKEVMKHFLNPKNAGKIQNPDAVGKINNDSCGDLMEVYLKINKKNNKIEDNNTNNDKQSSKFLFTTSHSHPVRV